MKSVPAFAGTVSIIFSEGMKGDSATRLSRSQLKPVLLTAGALLSEGMERSVWSASTSCSSCLGVMLKENTSSNNQPKTMRMLIFAFKFNYNERQKYAIL